MSQYYIEFICFSKFNQTLRNQILNYRVTRSMPRVQLGYLNKETRLYGSTDRRHIMSNNLHHANWVAVTYSRYRSLFAMLKYNF